MLSNIICLFIKITDSIMHMGNGDVPVIFVRWEESRLEKVVSTNNLACALSEACNLPMYFYVWQTMRGGGGGGEFETSYIHEPICYVFFPRSA